LALLALAVAAGCQAHAVHVDHGIRPEGADEAARVADAAHALGATFESCRVEVLPGPDLEARARWARYQVLPPGVLTGHTADDQAETVLLNLMRGCGLDGLRGIRDDGTGPGGARRPILALRRWETADLVRSLRLHPVADPSNDDRRFRRNRARHEVLPLLGSVAGRDPVPLLARTAALVGEDSDYLDTEAARLDPTDVKALLGAPLPLARRALRRWLRQSSDGEAHPPSYAELGRVWEVVSGNARACELSGGRRVSRSRGRLSVQARLR
jgi:tRNA(Ile)-lysidine synthase